MSCVAWRQTHQCNPDGQRDPAADKSCSTQIKPGSSGYCECTGDTDGKLHRVHTNAPFA